MKHQPHRYENVRRCALELEDTALLAKLAAGDMIAIEAKYHNNCLRSLYNKARQAAPKGNDRMPTEITEKINVIA